jgi:hypothetical protein
MWFGGRAEVGLAVGWSSDDGVVGSEEAGNAVAEDLGSRGLLAHSVRTSFAIASVCALGELALPVGGAEDVGLSERAGVW